LEFKLYKIYIIYHHLLVRYQTSTVLKITSVLNLPKYIFVEVLLHISLLRFYLYHLCRYLITTKYSRYFTFSSILVIISSQPWISGKPVFESRWPPHFSSVGQSFRMNKIARW